MARGQVSYTKVRALTRIANERNEAELVDIALTGTSGHVERIVAAYRRCEPAADDAEARAHRDRGVWIRSDDAECEFTVRLPAEAAKAVLGAIDVFLSRGPSAGSHAARRVDALVALAEHAVATASEVGRPDTRYLATVVLTPDVLDPDHAEGGGCCTVATGDGTGSDAEVAVPAVTASRMLCDAVVEGLVCDENGDPLRLGRRRRVVSPRLRRALWFRDRGCRFPGCTHRGWLDAHHIVHWLEHGETEQENLVLLCRSHHRFVHEQRWTITGDTVGELYFHSPKGRRLPSRPPTPIGDVAEVERHGCSADDARSGWLADLIDLDTAVGVLIYEDLAGDRVA